MLEVRLYWVTLKGLEPPAGVRHEENLVLDKIIKIISFFSFLFFCMNIIKMSREGEEEEEEYIRSS